MLSELIESAVIVQCPGGYTATLHFSDKRYDRIVSATSKYSLYSIVEFYVRTGRLPGVSA